MSDIYLPRGSSLELAFGLTAADVAGLPGYGKTTFVVSGARALDGAVAVAPDFVGVGLRRIVDCYVQGMHAAFGLSNFAEPTPFLLLLRRFADDVYAHIAARLGAPVLVDASAGNAEAAAIVRALYPEAFAADASPPARPKALDVATPAPIFVVGCPRSGTTFLQRMLQSHPLLAGPDGETILFNSVTDVFANPLLAELVSHEELVVAVRRLATGLFNQFQETHAPGARRLVEKTPGHFECLDTIAEVFPDASIIGIYRDGRDVVQSLLSVPFGTDDPVVATKGWVESVQTLRSFASRSDRVRLVRYEELRADPVAQTVDLLAWLGLPTDGDVTTTLASTAGTPVSQHNVRALDLSSHAENAVYRFGGDLLVELGYATAEEVRAVKRRPGYALDLARRRAGRYAASVRHR